MSVGTMVNGEYKQVSGGVPAGTLDRIIALEKELNQLKSEVSFKQSGEIEIESDYVVRGNNYVTDGNMVTIYLAINNQGKAFPKDRFSVGKIIQNIKPETQYFGNICGSTGINNVSNRSACIIIQRGGTLILDNYFYDDIKEFYIMATYFVAN